jgi:hypothetical protein
MAGLVLSFVMAGTSRPSRLSGHHPSVVIAGLDPAIHDESLLDQP